jgi:hypothetical protein
VTSKRPAGSWPQPMLTLRSRPVTETLVDAVMFAH